MQDSKMTEVDVFVGSTLLIDDEIFQLWVDGYSVEGASQVLVKRHKDLPPNHRNEVVHSYTLGQYRTYDMLEKALWNPKKLVSEWTFQMTEQSRSNLIAKYYELNPSVVREILNKKFSSRNRKDLDEISEKTNVSLKSCRRQFDNIKRIQKCVEELHGITTENIKNNFLLSDQLSNIYAAITFIAVNRLEVSKRRLQYINSQNLFSCAHGLMRHWGSKDLTSNKDSAERIKSENTEKEAENDLELDREFLADVCEIKQLLEKEKEFRLNVCSKVHGGISEKAYQDLENSFKTHFRNFVSISLGLHRSRDVRTFFVDCFERLIEPFRQAKWTKKDFLYLVSVYDEVGGNILSFDAHVFSIWKRYTSGMIVCLSHMYP